MERGLAEYRLPDGAGLLDPTVGFCDLAIRLGKRLFGDLDFALRDDLPLVEIAPDLDHLRERVGIPLIRGARALEARDVLARRADDLGGPAVGPGGLPRQGG